MFTKDLAIFGTCAAAIRNRPDGGHEELILTAFVISLSLFRPCALPCPLLFPPRLSFALLLFLSPTLSLICITRTTRLWIRTPTHTRLAVARQKPYISRGIRRREILKREKRPRTARARDGQEEGHWRGRRVRIMSSEICNNRALVARSFVERNNSSFQI